MAVEKSTNSRFVHDVLLVRSEKGMKINDRALTKKICTHQN